MKRYMMLFAGACLSSGLSATELVYTPVNPAFGGNPLNGTWMLNNAQAQNRHRSSSLSRTSPSSLTALQRFTSQLESRLLSQLLSDIQAGNTGSLTTDAFIINIIDDSGQLSILITDRQTGEVSEIIVNGLTNP
ncbi:curli assembly protein CsgF [Halopseudomonas phragmitis]|uniref:Curli production assembly/transport component CsgF n=2 Tax=Pseudomonadaceae TaxID=135621 RepID=A0A1V0B6H8_9GAMM|nr:MULTISPECIES: curli assembly protein CsgF [Pseudomonadaceae]AQZ95519.1 curli production assembly protein CsgF [Halopseudomonas phragmitis]PAU87323.1 curli production assembly protein CsgF [Pseudomonas sp. WN033]RHW22530.1 curli production assembly protein CsgF [Pseudomonas jilinensis]